MAVGNDTVVDERITNLGFIVEQKATILGLLMGKVILKATLKK
jgi:hypothetical protein